jgi:hypothetical protein
MKFLNRFGAYIAALVIFAAIACIYCSPSLEGKVVNAGDTSHFKGAVQEVKQYHEETGDYSFWTGSMFSGMPNYQIGGGHYKSSTLLKPLRKIALAGHKQSQTPAILIVYFISFFILLRAFKVNPWLSIVGAVAIGLSSYFLVIIPAGHITKTSTIALMAIAIGGFHLIYRKRYGLGALLTAFPVAIAFVNHPQMGYYIFLLIGLLFFAELYIHIKERRMKDFGLATLVFAFALLVGFGAQSANVFANKEYAEQTMRGGHSDLEKADDATNKTSGLDLDYATQWSYGIGESLSFLVPGVRGCASGYDVGTGSKLYKEMTRQGIDRRAAAQFCQSTPLYWGEQPFTSGNVYMGAIVCFLFVLGILLVKGPYKWALVAATAFSIALAWGSNFMPLTEFFFKHFPLYNKFRTVSSILIVAEITMPLLGFLALREMMGGRMDKKKAGRSVLIAAGVTGGICLVLALFGGSLFSFRSSTDATWSSDIPAFIYQGIIGERKALLAADAWRSLLFIAGAALVVWLFSQGKLRSGWMTAILGVLITVDMWQIDKRFFNDSNFIPAGQEKAYFAMQPYEKQILADPDPNFRVMNLTTSTFNDARTSYRLKSVGGYSAAKLRRYQDLIDQHISKMNMNVLNMLNTKYFITKGADGKPQVVRNPEAMGNAWFVDTLTVVGDANAESDALNRLDLHTTAVLDKEFASFATQPVRTPDSTRTVSLTKYTPRYLDYESTSAQPATIVFSEIYYPYGWRATIDGQPADHFRVDYMLRALNVPAGHHQIHFEFAPDSVRRGDTLSTACILVLYAATLFIIGREIIIRRKKSKKVAINE